MKRMSIPERSLKDREIELHRLSGQVRKGLLKKVAERKIGRIA